MNLPTRRPQSIVPAGSTLIEFKPSNILVTLHDGVPVTKVIDFGIAKVKSRGVASVELTNRADRMREPAWLVPYGY